MVEATPVPVPAGRLGRRARLSALAAVPLVVACFTVFGLSSKAFLGAFFVTVLVVVSIIDLEERRLPNVIVLPAFAIVLAAHLALSPDRAAEWTIAAFGAALFLFLPTVIMPGGMGMGDFKLALLLGAMLGWAVVTAILVASVVGALAAIGVLLLRGAAARKQAIPFGPFLALGGIVALFVGMLPSL
jgi:leader peptidase (prepilin peptidase) / N-methyltransferase